MHRKRIENLRSQFKSKNLDALFITRKENRFYLSCFTGSSGNLLITKKEIFLLTDSRYQLQAKKESPHCHLIDISADFPDIFYGLVKQNKILKLGFESSHLTFRQCQQLKKTLKGNTRLVPVNDLVENLRKVKSKQELDCLAQAQEITDKAFLYIKNHFKAGITEKQIAWILERCLREKGSNPVPFLPIVASGTNTAEPHHKSSDKKIKSGETVIMDFGAAVAGYNSDMTRTVFIGEPTKKQTEIYRLVLSAQQAALGKLKAGITGKDVDSTARKIIEHKNMGKYFRHNLGHGVGLEVHEKPTLGISSKEVLIEDMVCTVEPGIYLPGWGGIRIEDMVVVQQDGVKNLTKSPKKIEEIIINI